MEDGGKTMVAIIQGLRDTGLAIALLSGAQPQNSQKSRNKVAVTKSSVKTNTEFYKRNSSAQINGAHYASSYQVAHCRYTPSSPAQLIPEFPEQRRTPSRTKGNFKQSGCYSYKETPSEFKQQKNRESFCHSPSPSPPPGSFVASLRKYPIQPGKCPSLELVQRLLNYTQDKHLSRQISHSKRSVASRSVKHKKANTLTSKTCRSLQTYTRIVNEVPAKEKPRGSSSMKNRSDARPELDQLSETYNYLKVPSGLRQSYTGPCSEVRYLNNIKSYIRKTIRQFVNQSPAITCPKIRSRYEEHRKVHHRQIDSTTNTINENEVNTEVMKAEETTMADIKRKLKDSCLETSPSIGTKRSCSFSLFRRCLCEDKASATRGELSMTDHEATVRRWLEDLPIFADNTPDNQKLYLEMLPELNTKLIDLIGQDDYDEKAMNEIRGFISILHLPNSLYEDSSEIDEPGDNMSDEENELNSRNNMDTARKILNPMTPDEKFKHARNLVNELSPKTLTKVGITDRPVTGLLEDGSNIPGDLKARNKFLDKDFDKKLAQMKSESVDDDIIDAQIKTYADSMSDTESTMISAGRSQLTKENKSTMPAKYYPNAKDNRSVIKNLDKLLDNPAIPEHLKNKNQILVQNFDKKLKELQSKNASDDVIEAEIRKLVDSMEAAGMPMTRKQKNKIIDDMLNDVKSGQHEDVKNKNRSVIKHLDKFLDNPATPEHAKNKNQILVQNFDKKLKELQSQNASDDIIEAEIRKLVESMEAAGMPMAPKQKNQMIHDMINDVKSGKHEDVKNKNQNVIKHLDKFLDNPAIPENVKNKNQMLVQNFDKKLKELQSQNVSDDVIEAEIRKLVDSMEAAGMPMTSKQKNQMRADMINDVKSGKHEDVENKNQSVVKKLDKFLDNPAISEHAKNKNQILVQNFDKKLKELQSQNASDDVVEAEIRKLVDSIEAAGMPMTPKQKNQMIADIINDVKSGKHEYVENKNRSVVKKFDKFLDNPAIYEHVKNKNQMLVQNFDKKLKELQSQNASDDVIKTEIRKLVDSIEAAGMPMTPKQKSKMIADILNDVKSVKHEDVKNKDHSVVKNLDKFLDNPATPEHVKNKNQILVQNLDKKLKDLQSQNASDDVIEAEIRKLVESMEAAGMPMAPKQKNQMIHDMLNDVKSGKHEDVKNKNRNVIKHLDKFLDNPAKPENVKNKNQMLVQNFDKKLKELQSQNVSDDVIEAEIRKLVDSMEAAGMPMTPKQKNQMSADMINDVKSGKHEDVENKNQSVVKKLDKFLNNPAISEHFKNKNQILVQNFDKKLKELQSQNASDDVVEAEIRKLVDSIEAAGMPMMPKHKNQMIADIINEVKSGKHEDVENKNRSVVKKLDKFLDNPAIYEHVKNKNQMLVQNFDKKLKDLQSQNASDDVIKTEIRKLVDSMEAAGMPMTRKQKNKMIADILNDVKSVKHEDVKNKDHSVVKNLDTFLDNPATPEHVKNKNQILVQNFDKKLKELQSQNASDDVIKTEIRKLVDSMEAAGMPMTPNKKNQMIAEMLNDLKSESKQRKRWDENIQNDKIKRNRPGSISSESTSKKAQIVSPQEKRKLKEEVNKQILDFNKDVTGDEPTEIQNKRKKNASQLADNVTETMSNFAEKFVPIKNDKIMSDVTRYLEKEAFDTPEPINQLAKRLIRRLDMINFETSTPDDEIENRRRERATGQLKGHSEDDEKSESNTPGGRKKPKARSSLAETKYKQDPAAINKTVDKWANSLPFSKMDSSEKADHEDLKDELKDGINQVGLHNEPEVRDKIKTFLENSPVDLKKLKDKANFFDKQEDQLIATLKKALQKERSPESGKFVKEAVEQWVKTLNLPETDDGDQIEILDEAKADLVSTLLNDVVNADKSLGKKVDEVYPDAIAEFLEKIPTHSYQPENIDQLVKSLQDTVNKFSKKYSPTGRPVKRKAADVLLEDIGNWVKNLPVESDIPEDETDKIRQMTDAKLIHKIGELNMNPEVLNDDFLFEDILGDEIDNLLADVQNKKIENDQAKLKRELLDIVRKARQNIREENSGQVYKQQLRETIAKTLPPVKLDPEGNALLEVLKDTVTDVFINMHYVSSDEQEINKLKNKIIDEINKFLKDHLKSSPALPLGTRKIFENLYDAMEKINELQTEAFKDEVKLVKLKNEINNWAKDLPLKSQTGQEKLQTNKMINNLAKKLLDIENMRGLIPDSEYDEKIIKEIIKFLEKLLLTTDDDDEESLDQLAKNLMENLRDTVEKRTLDAANKHSIQSTVSCSCTIYSIPPSTLSKEDQDHLNRIRQRTSPKQGISFNDASLSPSYKNTGSQTDIVRACLGTCPIQRPCLAQRNSSAQTPTRRMQAVGSQMCESNVDEPWSAVDERCMRPPRISSPCLASYRPSCSSMNKFRRSTSPVARNPCMSGAPKSCSHPCMSHPPQMHFANHRGSQRPCGPQNQCRAPCISPDYQMAYKPTPCRSEQLLLTQVGIQCSMTDLSTPPYVMSDESNTSPQENPRLYQHISYPYEPMSGGSDQNHQRPKLGSQRSQYCTSSQQCSAEEMPSQRSSRETRNNPYSPCSGRMSQMHWNRRSHQDSQPRKCMVSHLNLPSEGQSCLTLQNNSQFCPSQQIRWSRNSRLSYASPDPPEEYETRPSCSFQNRMTHLGSFDKPRNQDWDKVQASRQSWEMGYGHCLVSEEESHREGKLMCRYKPKCGKYSSRRKPCHLHNDESMNCCTKCRGVHCPYPSYLFFR